MRKRLSIFLLCVALLLLSGCGDKSVSLDPPDIEYGLDMSQMGMPVIDPRFTVATMPKGSSEWLLFDDVGEFLKYAQTVSDQFQVVWVPDVTTEEWVKVEDAWFVQSDEYCYSPMKWCVAAFATESAARDAHREFGGEIWSWNSVLDNTWDSAPVPAGG